MKSLMLGDTGKVFCTGFQGNGEREMAIWDIVSPVLSFTCLKLTLILYLNLML